MNELHIALEYYISTQLVGVFCSRPIRIRPPAETCRHEVITSGYFFLGKLSETEGEKRKRERRENCDGEGNPLGIPHSITIFTSRSIRILKGFPSASQFSLLGQ